MDLPSPKRLNRNAAISDEAAESQCVAAYNGASERAIQVSARRAGDKALALGRRHDSG
jgi:hypothetical protein